MSLNVSKGNMYEFITHTWNTVKGKCYHDCSYCYMKRFKNQKPVRFDAKELNTDLGSGNYIFVGSSCDMWAKDIPDWWIVETLRACDVANKNKYFFQTKNPERMLQYLDILESIDYSICVTIESDVYYPQYMRLSPEIQFRGHPFWFKLFPENVETYITIEPIMDFNLPLFAQIIKMCNPKQVNIGADSRKSNLPEPSSEKTKRLIEELSKFTIVHTKKNLKRLLK